MTRPAIFSLGLPAALIAGALASPLAAQSGSFPYTLIDIGDLAPPGQSDGTNATGMNELGHVAAVTGDGTNGGIAVLYRDGELVQLGGFPGEIVGGGSKGVNNLDQVVGWSLMQHPVFGGWQSEPFLWTEGSGMVNPIDHLPENYNGESWGINDSGQQTFNTGGASFWDPVTGFHQIHFEGQPVNSGWKAWEINEDGVVCGSARGPSGFNDAFRYVSATDTTINLNDPLLDHHSDAYGLNDRGDIAGWAFQFDNFQKAMVWTADGQSLRLPAGELGVNQFQGTAEHMNNHGDVVGQDTFPGPTGGNPDFEPIGWVATEVLDTSPIVKTRLVDLIDPAEAALWRILHPFEINDRGEICGIATAAAGGPSGGARGFLMVPNTPDRFRNLSNSLPGVNGHPVLIAKGTLEPNSPLEVDLYKAAPSAMGFLAFGFDTLYAPVYGGVFVPDIFSVGGRLLPTSTDATGGQSLSASWPIGVPADLEFSAQYWIVDPAAPFGYSASNAITQTTR